MDDEDDIFATMGGSLLNDLLADLDNTKNDDLFASLEKELATSYGSGNDNNKIKAPPGLGSAGAFVVNQQQSSSSSVPLSATTSATAPAVPITNPEDAWSAALAQFGGMSLAADFLAADTAKKNNQTSTSHPDLVQTESGMLGEAISSNVVDALFEDDEEDGPGEYKLEEDVKINNTKDNTKTTTAASDDDGIDETGGLMALLGAASSSRSSKTTTSKSVTADAAPEVTKRSEISKEGEAPPSITTPDKSGTMAPPPSPMFPPPFPPGVMPPPNSMMPPIPQMMSPPPHPGMMMPPPHPGMMMMPPPPNMQAMPPPPHPGMMVPPPHHPGMMMMGGGRPPAVPPPSATKANRKFEKDFPALGDEPPSPEEKSQDSEDEDEAPTTTSGSVLPSSIMHRPNIRIIFNNADPSAPSIPAKSVSTSLMPQRDLCYIIHSMLRPLQSLDTYNDDYYHWSFVDRKSRNLLLLGGADRSTMESSLAQPNPVWKEVKVMAMERESKFRSAVETRAREFAEEKQSLGRMVKANVKRPKALLNVPVMATGGGDEGDGGVDDMNNDVTNVDDKNYVLEQRRNRVQLWKARVSIDKGYSAFLSLTELRRLIQANASQPQLVQELMGDVTNNIDMMHASLGVVVRVNADGSRQVIIDEARLSSTLSLPKGRTLCARVMEGGILPHQSACELLPVAWHAIASTTPSSVSDDTEDRLLRALTSLVVATMPAVDPSILCCCLDATISIGNDLSNITKSRVRMELLHSILSRGKTACEGYSDLDGVWKEKEKEFMQILASQKK